MGDEFTFAVISDIHANYEALSKTLNILQKRHVDKIICLGDVIGYGANPNECIDLLKNRIEVVLIGNHEEMLKNGFNSGGKLSEISNTWTRTVINDEAQEYIERMGYTSYKWNGIGFYHSIKNGEGKWIYPNDIETIDALFGNRERICFFGHTHRPRIILKSNEDDYIKDIRIKKTTSVTVDTENCKAYINPGSIGQQRDNKTDLSFAICNIRANQMRIKIERHHYNSFKTYKKIKRDGCGTEVASYFVREKWRRIIYEIFDRMIEKNQ